VFRQSCSSGFQASPYATPGSSVCLSAVCVEAFRGNEIRHVICHENVARLRYSHSMRAISTLILLLASFPVVAQSADPHSIPAVDAGLGSCSADLTITDTANKPVYNAKIEVRVSYGRFHRMDLEVSTNIDGKARFTGIPANTRHGLLYQASEGDRAGNAFQDPSNKCNAQFTIVLRKSSQPPDPDQ
jgi:hypothetical protein